MKRSMAVGLIALALALNVSGAAHAQCVWTNLTNGNTADAGQVMGNFACKAPITDPIFSGQIGLGTSTLPSNLSSSLTIAGATNPGFALRNSATGVGTSIGTDIFLAGDGSLEVDVRQPHEIRFSTADTRRLTIGSTGNVYVGTAASPNVDSILNVAVTGNNALHLHKLQSTNDTGYATYYMGGSSGATTRGVIGVTHTGSGADTILPGEHADGLAMYSQQALDFGVAGTSLAATILANGNMGVGTANPAQRLDVAGTIRQAGCVNATLQANASGDITCVSDARLKTIKGRYSGGLRELGRLEPVRFSYSAKVKDAGERFEHAGFLAQNVMTAIPQAVALQKNGYYALDTTAILAASVNAIKELQAINERQTRQLRHQAEQYEALSLRLAALERERAAKHTGPDRKRKPV